MRVRSAPGVCLGSETVSRRHCARAVLAIGADAAVVDVGDEQDHAARFEKLSDYQSNLTFQSLPYEMNLMDKDSVLKQKRERWHTSLSKDVYIEEALNVLNDLKMTYGIKTKILRMFLGIANRAGPVMWIESHLWISRKLG